MFHFHFYVHLKRDADGREFCERVREFMSYLYEREYIGGFNIARRQFTIDPPNLGEYHVVVDFETGSQMSRAFNEVGQRRGETEEFHKAVIDCVADMTVALYRDYPEVVRRGLKIDLAAEPRDSAGEPLKVPSFLEDERKKRSQ